MKNVNHCQDQVPVLINPDDQALTSWMMVGMVLKQNSCETIYMIRQCLIDQSALIMGVSERLFIASVNW